MVTSGLVHPRRQVRDRLHYVYCTRPGHSGEISDLRRDCANSDIKTHRSIHGVIAEGRHVGQMTALISAQSQVRSKPKCARQSDSLFTSQLLTWHFATGLLSVSTAYKLFNSPDQSTCSGFIKHKVIGVSVCGLTCQKTHQEGLGLGGLVQEAHLCLSYFIKIPVKCVHAGSIDRPLM